MSEEIVLEATDGTGTNSISHSTPRYGSVKLAAPVAPTASGYTVFQYIPLPAQLAGRTVLAAYLDIEMDSGAGSRTMSVVRHAKVPSGSYTTTTHDNKPGTLAGATARTVTQVGTITKWRYDVKADLVAIAAGGAYYGWAISSTYTSVWMLHAWQSSTPPKLTVVLADNSGPPVGLRPDGVTSLAKPVLTWTPLNGLVSARAQIDAVGGNFSAPLFDTGNVPTTEGQLDLSATAYGGLADGASVILRALQTTDSGDSTWSVPITITRDAYSAAAISSPPSTSTDPTPALVWSFAGQARYQVTVTKAGKIVADSGVVPGSATAWAPPDGATVAGDQLLYRLRLWDTATRTSSPGDPGYVELSTTVTYNPGTATAVDSFSASQDGVRPWVNLAWTRAAGIPDEWVIIRDGAIIARIDGTASGSPVLSFRDYTTIPNKAQAYVVRPVIAGATGAASATITVTPIVTGIWLTDPSTGESFSHSGHDQNPSYAETSVVLAPVGAPRTYKRTFALRGLEGSVSGVIDEYDGRTVAQQEASAMVLKAAASSTLRHVAGDVNVPVTVTDLTTLIDHDAPGTKNVSYQIRQTGELPFPEVAL